MRRRRFNALLGAGAASLAVGTSALLSGCQRSGSARNVLMVCIDDLNDYPGFMGGYTGNANTPFLDALAASAQTFTNAHACVPVCMPSRASVLLGRSPVSTQILGHGGAYLQQPPPNSDFGRYRAAIESPLVASLPQMVKKYSPYPYKTLSIGKVFHTAEPEQWDVQAPYTELGKIYNRYPSDTGDFFSYGLLDRGDTHQDQLSADWASQILSTEHSQPLFIALGFYQPHVPWRLPQWAFDLHPLENVVVPEHRPDDLEDVPEHAKELARRPLIMESLSNFELVQEKGTQRQIVQAYLAAMSHTDRMLGQVLNAIADGPNADSTDILLWSDHGYHLGEKLHVRKATLWEESTRVPLIVRLAGGKHGVKSDSAVSLLDITPTIIDMVGGDAAQAIAEEGLHGSSLFSDSRSPAITFWDGAKSIRTHRWRYTRYPEGAEELYDHHADPDEYENLAGLEAYQMSLNELRDTLNEAVSKLTA